MLVMRSVVAMDKKVIALRSTSTNINEVPAWIQGNTLSLSKWNVTLMTPQGNEELVDLSYPIEVHHTLNQHTSITTIRLFRSVGAEELYFELNPQIVSGDVLDMKIEFIEQGDS